MPSHQYEYQPLSVPAQIRLLHIVPNSLDTPLQTELVESSLEQAGGYVALSYVWGDTEPSYDLFINNQHLGIRENLFTMQKLYCILFHLSNYPSLLIFIDRTPRNGPSPLLQAITRCTFTCGLQGGCQFHRIRQNNMAPFATH